MIVDSISVHPVGDQFRVSLSVTLSAETAFEAAQKIGQTFAQTKVIDDRDFLRTGKEMAEAKAAIAEAKVAITEAKIEEITAAKVEAAKADEAPEPARPKRGRRGKVAPAAKTEEAKVEEAPAEKPKRGRRPKAAPAEQPAEPTISDEDLMRAASELSSKTDPNVVMEILTEDYGVEKVNDVPADKRQELLDEFARNMEDDD